MNATQQELLRALIAAQVAVLEWGDEDVSENVVCDGLDAALKQAVKAAKKLRNL